MVQIVSSTGNMGVQLKAKGIKNTYVCVGRNTYKLGDYFAHRREVQMLDLMTGAVVGMCPYGEPNEYPASCMKMVMGRCYQFHSRNPH